MATNDDLFHGTKRQYWRLRAHGCSEPQRQRDQSWDYPKAGGMANRNGGIILGEEVNLSSDTYYRFVDSKIYRTYGEKSCFGNWWISYEVMVAVAGHTAKAGGSLDDAANAGYLLALVDEWGDRKWLAKALLRQQLRAWMGRGNVAAGQGGRYIPPQHRKDILQLFVPGDRTLLERAFHTPRYELSNSALGSGFIGGRLSFA